MALMDNSDSITPPGVCCYTEKNQNGFIDSAICSCIIHQNCIQGLSSCYKVMAEALQRLLSWRKCSGYDKDASDTLCLGRIFNFKWGANNLILKSTHYLIAGNIVSIVGSAVKDTTMVRGSVCGPQSQQCVWEIVSLLAVPGASSCQTLHHVTMQS